MIHDPLCPSAYAFGVCECPLITKVRADERAAIYADMVAKGEVSINVIRRREAK